MIQIRTACKRKGCTAYGDLEVLNLPMVGRNKEALPVLLCSLCRDHLAVEFVDPNKEGVVLEGG